MHIEVLEQHEDWIRTACEIDFGERSLEWLQFSAMNYGAIRVRTHCLLMGSRPEQEGDEPTGSGRETLDDLHTFAADMPRECILWEQQQSRRLSLLHLKVIKGCLTQSAWSLAWTNLTRHARSHYMSATALITNVSNQAILINFSPF